MRALARVLSPFRHRHASTPSLLPLSTITAASKPSSRPRPRPLNPRAGLTPEEVAQVCLLVPRLCGSGRLREAVRLIDACLLTEPPLDSLPLAALVGRLCRADEPGMAHSMALLTALLHNPRCSPENLAAICSMLIDAYLEHRRPRDALKLFDWMIRPKSPCPPGPDVCRAVVEGMCQHGRTLEALRVLREMVGGRGFEVVGSEMRTHVYRSLLREARVREAEELDGVLGGVSEGDRGDRGRAVEVLDRMIKNWKD